MQIAIVGTGFIGSTLGRSLARAGHDVTFGSRRDAPVEGVDAPVVPVADAIGAADVVILAVPGPSVAELGRDFGDALAGKLVVDATNQMGQATANGRRALPDTVRYARAFNTLGGENFADPVFRDGTADLFFSSPAADRGVVEAIVTSVGLRPVYLGEDQEALVDALFRVWIQLVMGEGHSRHLAFKLLEDE